jgi:hypothetical protein
VILLTLGLPGRFAQWCDAVVARLAGEAGGEVTCTAWPPLGDMLGYETVAPALRGLARHLIATNSAHVVFGLRYPDQRLREALTEKATRFVVALDDPCEAAADIFEETGAEAKAVVRAVANSCPLILQFGGLPGALVVRAEDARAEPAAAVSTIAAHLGIGIAPRRAAMLLAELEEAGISPSRRDGEGLAARPAAALLAPFDGALLAYREGFGTGRLDEIVWKRDFFAFGEGNSPTEPFDVAGGSRILIYGPYIHLPAGSWTAQAVLGFSPEAARHTFLVDIYGGVQLASTTFRPEKPGVYKADLTFSVGEPSGQGLEVRVMVTDDRAVGQLAFGHVVLRPLAMRSADPAGGSGSDFTDVLAL